MKHNPLFVDSTKLHGDAVPTTFELHNVMLYEGEKIILCVKEKSGEFHREVLKINEKTNEYSTYIYLAHQTRVTYQFVIQKEDNILFKSQQYTDLAKYNLETKWLPCLDVDILSAPKPESPVKPHKGFMSSSYSSSNLEKVIKKWGF